MLFASKGLPLNSGLTRPGIDSSTAHRGQALEIAQAGMSHEYCRGISDEDAYPPPSDPSSQLLIPRVQKVVAGDVRDDGGLSHAQSRRMGDSRPMATG